MKNILIIGDLHLSEHLGHYDAIRDERVSERKEVLDFIIEKSESAKHVIFLGDQFNQKNPSAKIIQEFVEFIERFSDKQVYIISGNHETQASGSSALSFLKEIKNKDNWHIFTDSIESTIIEGKKFIFAPFMSRVFLECADDKTASKKIMKKILAEKGDILCVHQSISGTKSNGGLVDLFPEPVLDGKKINSTIKKTFAGHIHAPSENGNIIISGSIFCNEINEKERYVYLFDAETMEAEKVKIPERGIYKVENQEELKNIPKSSIVKFILSEKLPPQELDALKEELKKFDGYILSDDSKTERKKDNISDKNLLELSTTELLGEYAKQKKVDIEKLMKGFELINNT